MTTPDGTCCEKCFDPLGFDGERIGICTNRDCPCHTPTTPSSTWREDFRKLFVAGIPDSGWIGRMSLSTAESIEKFIEKIESQARTEGAKAREKELLDVPWKEMYAGILAEGERIGREKASDIVSDLATGSGCLQEKWKCCGYHDALTEVMEKLEASNKEGV